MIFDASASPDIAALVRHWLKRPWQKERWFVLRDRLEEEGVDPVEAERIAFGESRPAVAMSGWATHVRITARRKMKQWMDRARAHFLPLFNLTENTLPVCGVPADTGSDEPPF